MKRTDIVAVTATVLVAGAVGAWWGPVASGQVVVRGGRDRTMVASLLGGQSGRLGLSVRDVDAEVAAKNKGTAGVLVEEVQSEGPAAKAGLRAGDIVVEYDGERVRSTRQFTRLVQESVPGRAVAVVVLRDGQRTTLNVEPAAGGAYRFFYDGFDDLLMPKPPMPPAPPEPPEPPVPPAPPVPADPLWRLEEFIGSNGRLGVTVDTLSPQLAEYFGATEGVLVTSVSANSAASKAGLKAGDVITALNGDGVSSPSALRQRSQRLANGDEFTLAIVRDRKPLTVKGKVEARQPRRWTDV